MSDAREALLAEITKQGDVVRKLKAEKAPKDQVSKYIHIPRFNSLSIAQQSFGNGSLHSTREITRIRNTLFLLHFLLLRALNHCHAGT
jgi:hypothetical protein